ncbi:hypothetical protein RQP46_007347 [Phenoliferia psychrophenolica]
MPQEVTDLKQFLLICKRSDAKSVRVKKTTSRKTGASGISATKTKFKVRCSKYLYTISIANAETAEKLRASLPPSLTVTDVGKETKAKK